MAGVSARRVHAIARSEARHVVEGEAEHKWLDTTINQTVTTTPALFLLTQLGQGATESTRLGLQVRPLYATFRLYCYQSVAATSGNILRVVVVLDTQQNGVTPTLQGAADSVLRSASGATMQLRNPRTTSRFVILADKVVRLMPNGNNLQSLHFTRRLRCTTHFYTGTNTNPTDFGPNQVYAFFISDQATNGPQVQGDMRLRFIDV